MILLRIINLISIPPRSINSKKESKHSRTRKIYRGSSQCKTTSLPVTAVFHYDDKNFGPPGGGLVPPSTAMETSLQRLISTNLMQL